jgi:hypothetical protein
MAVGLSDVLERRTRLSLADRNAGLGSAAPRLVAGRIGAGAVSTEAVALAERLAGERGPVARPEPVQATVSDASPGSARVVHPGA